MKKRRLSKKRNHAVYDVEEEGFVCRLCEEKKTDRWVYDWDIVPHLKQAHGINRSEQVIVGWNSKFEVAYRKHRNEPVSLRPEETGEIIIDNTPKKKYEEEKKRRLLEAQARREAMS